jgi:vitamin B12 transporter
MRSGILWLGILGGAIPALAQPTAQPQPQSQPDPGAAHAASLYEEVLVTGALADESRERLPVSADVIERDEIAARQATVVADLLRSVPGLDVVRSGTAGKVTSLFTRGTESDHTLVLWNGIELNDPFFGGFDWGLLPTEGVQRIEVIRGPFSALYGSDALGGVVQVLTGGAPGSGASLELGENGYQRAAVTAGGEIGSLRYDVAAHSRRGDGLADNDFYDSDELVAQASWQAGRGAELGVVVRTNRSDLGIPFSGGVVTPERTTRWRETELALPVRFEIDRWTVEGRLSQVSHDSELSDPDDPFGFTFAESRSTSQRARLVASYHFDDDLWLAIGSEYEGQEVDSGSVFGVDLDGARQTTHSYFSQLFHAVGDWRFDAGLRRDDHDVFGGVTSPRLGVARRIGARGRLRAAYGEGFRAPSLGELFFPFSGNRDLEPERSESFELGYEYRGAGRRDGRGDGRDDGWTATVTAFHNELDNLIDFDFVAFRNVNVGRARTRGVELGVARRRGRLDLRANATYLEAVDRDTGERLLRRPEWRGSLVASWAAADWTWTGTALYTGERDDVDPIDFERTGNSAYQRFDLAARYRGWQRLTPYARLENVADEEYAEALGFPAPGRQLVGGLSVAF